MIKRSTAYIAKNSYYCICSKLIITILRAVFGCTQYSFGSLSIFFSFLITMPPTEITQDDAYCTYARALLARPNWRGVLNPLTTSDCTKYSQV